MVECCLYLQHVRVWDPVIVMAHVKATTHAVATMQTGRETIATQPVCFSHIFILDCVVAVFAVFISDFICVLQLARVLEDATDMEHAKVTTHVFVSARIGQEQLVTSPVCCCCCCCCCCPLLATCHDGFGVVSFFFSFSIFRFFELWLWISASFGAVE